MKFTPYPYQQYCIDKIVSQPSTGLFIDMGLGKTVISLTAMHDLKYNRFSLCKVLVIAPKKVAEATWSTEAAKWDHLSRWRVVSVLGSEAQRIKALETDADMYVINRENTQWLTERCGLHWPFDAVILDESSSFKNPRAKRFRALKTVRPKIKCIVELSGTPRPRSLLDLWAQIYLLDGGERLGRTISAYRDIYFIPGRRNRTTIFTYDPKPGAEETVYQKISDICVSMKSEDYLDLPDLIYEDVPVVLDAQAQKAYRKLEREALLEVDEEVITAGSAGVLTNKLLQLCNGAVYSEDGTATEVHRCKLDAFLEVLESLNGEPAFVMYGFRHDADRILAALEKTDLRVRVYQGSADADDWNAGKIDVLLAHPASCGYGLNLQQGGHHMIWFGLTWCLEWYQQANKRLHRQGQTKPVIIHNLVVQGGVDQDVMKSLNTKNAGQDTMLEALKARIRAAKDSGQDTMLEALKARIRAAREDLI